MSSARQVVSDIRRLKRLCQDIKNLFVNRDGIVDLMALALICHEHVLLLGLPGSGKSELVLRFARGIHASRFQYLLTRFTEPSELFGPVDLEAFRQGRFNVITEGMLPEAEVAFLDEVFQASSAILNTLLSVVHERTFYNGRTPQKVPLISLFAASNTLPDDPGLNAFTDRFILRAQVEPIPDNALGDLVDKGWYLEASRIRPETAGGDAAPGIAPDTLRQLHARLPDIGIDNVRTLYMEVIRRLRAEGVAFSERRLIKGLKLIRAAALLAERDQATAADLWPLNHIWNSADEITTLRNIVQPLVDEAGGPSLVSSRPVGAIEDDFQLLRSRQPDSESAWVAHLGALADLRRELVLYHPTGTELIAQVNAEIGRHLESTGSGGN